MTKRPISLTLISWYLIIISAITLITNLIFLDSHITKLVWAHYHFPHPIPYILIYAGSIISLIVGIAILKAQNWARILFAAWGAIKILILLIFNSFGMMQISRVLLYFSFLFFLYRSKAQSYFMLGERT